MEPLTAHVGLEVTVLLYHRVVKGLSLRQGQSYKGYKDPYGLWRKGSATFPGEPHLVPILTKL